MTFIPIIALQGIEGKMFAPLAFTYVIALSASLALSLVAIPAFCQIVLKPHPDRKSFLVEGAKALYMPVLRWGLRHRALVSTEIYAKIDLAALQEVARPRPAQGGVR